MSEKGFDNFMNDVLEFPLRGTPENNAYLKALKDNPKLANPKGFDISKISDIRLKTDIELTGKSPAGVNIYSFKYKGDDKTYEGVMAQEVPWASIKGDDGYYRVDYSKVDVEFKRLN